jgi:predicted DNA-binding transcriptional regulator AlpA
MLATKDLRRHTVASLLGAWRMHPTQSAPTERLTLNIDTVATVLGINRSTAFELARRDQLPVPVIRLGRRLVVSRRALEAVLDAQHPGLDDPDDTE